MLEKVEVIERSIRKPVSLFEVSVHCSEIRVKDTGETLKSVGAEGIAGAAVGEGVGVGDGVGVGEGVGVGVGTVVGVTVASGLASGDA
jgi:hypothetical protein